MFKELIDFLIGIKDSLVCWVIIDQYDAGVMLRLGKYYRTLEPGIHWKIPFVDKPVTATVVTTTMNLPSQGLLTKDNKSVAVSSIIQYNISDARLFLLTVYEARDALSDVIMGAIKSYIAAYEYDKLRTENQIPTKRLNQIKEAMSTWGIDVTNVVVTDFQPCRTIRLAQDLAYKSQD